MPEQPANAYCFLLPDQENPHYKAASGGIISPKYLLLPKNTRLYRFGHSVDAQRNNVPRSRNYASPWWFGAQDFASFLTDSPPERPGFILDPGQAPPTGFQSHAFNHLVRARLAVVRQFGQADRIISATLLGALGCFAGKGKPISEDPSGQLRPLIGDGVSTLFADPEITQFYIPGLRSDPKGSVSHLLVILKDRPAHEFFIF